MKKRRRRGRQLPGCRYYTKKEWAAIIGDGEVLGRFLLSNDGLVHDLLQNKFKVHPESSIYADGLQEGRMGLLVAARKFDPCVGCTYATYATWWVRQKVGRFLDEQVHIIRTPAYIHHRYLRLRKEEVMGELNGGREELARLRRLYSKITPAPLGMEDGCLSPDLIADVKSGEGMRRVEDREVLEDLSLLVCRVCSSIEAEIIAARFLRPVRETLISIGRRHRLSRERIRQIEAKALDRLYAAIEGRVNPNPWHCNAAPGEKRARVRPKGRPMARRR